MLGRFAILTMAVIAATSSCNAFPAVSKGVEIRICQDRDCLTDGALKANEIVETLCKKSSGNTPVTVSKCGCLGPCGKGPNVDIKIDGVSIKDGRKGQSNFYVFRQIDSAEAAADMLEQAGIKVNEKAVDRDLKVESTRSLFDFDRTTRIALQRLLYACVALALNDADKNGTWDVINGEVYPNSYYAIAVITFIGSQFMGTSSKANSMGNAEE